MAESRPSATQPPGRNRAEQSLPYSFRDRLAEMFAKRELKRKQRRYGTHHLIAGTSAGLVTTAALYPLDLVKTRYQVTAMVAGRGRDLFLCFIKPSRILYLQLSKQLACENLACGNLQLDDIAYRKHRRPHTDWLD